MMQTPVITADRQAKKRHAVGDAERRRIRRRYKEHPCNQKEMCQWYLKETGHSIVQGRMSDILSTKYQHLDDDNRNDRYLTSFRNVRADYPDLEQALYDWQQRMEKQGAPLTGDILRAKAHEIWLLLSQYAD